METRYYVGASLRSAIVHAALTIDGINFLEQNFTNDITGIHRYFQQLKRKFKFSNSQLVVCVEFSGIRTCRLIAFLMENQIPIYVELKSEADRSAKQFAQEAFKNFPALNFRKPNKSVIQRLKLLMFLCENFLALKDRAASSVAGALNDLVISGLSKSSLRSLTNDIKKIEHEFEREIFEGLTIKAHPRD